MIRLRIPALAAASLIAACAASPASDPLPPPPADEGDRPGRLSVYRTGPERGRQLAVAPDTGGTVEVTGTARVQVTADRARVTFAVETEGSTARAASGENAERMDAVHRALREAGNEDLRIETFGYALQPRYRRPDRGQGDPREIDGYRATNYIRVVTDEPRGVGGLIDAAIGAGANRVASLDFYASDTEEARLDALRQAVTGARREAETIAEALGVGLGPPIEVRGGAEVPRSDVRGGREMMTAAVETPVEPGIQTVSASVTIRYRLGESGP